MICRATEIFSQHLRTLTTLVETDVSQHQHYGVPSLLRLTLASGGLTLPTGTHMQLHSHVYLIPNAEHPGMYVIKINI